MKILEGLFPWQVLAQVLPQVPHTPNCPLQAMDTRWSLVIALLGLFVPLREGHALGIFNNLLPLL